jgi:hypothetical protein
VPCPCNNTLCYCKEKKINELAIFGDEMTVLSPAKTLDEVLDLFEPTTEIDLQSNFYVPRDETGLTKLTKKLKRNKQFHGFLCGHVGSGKTTELMRLAVDDKINELYFPLLISVKDFQVDNANLTHDALFVNIGLKLIEKATAKELNPKFADELHNWGKTLINTYINEESIDAKAGSKANFWVVYYNALLRSRTQWKQQEKIQLEPKIQDLIDLLNNMAQDLKNNTGKRLLVMIDDLEKGISNAEKQMHDRLFSEYYNVLIQPRFNIIYTLPVYFRGKTDNRIDKESIFAFSAQRIYEPENKKDDKPALNKQSPGYLLIKQFIEQRLDSTADLFEEDVLDELIRIGNGLFRDTDVVIADAADYAMDRGADKIALVDTVKVFNHLKKDYQPSIRSKEIAILEKIANSEKGWVDGVEPLLQSRAVVEYENGDLWLDVRYVLKAYVKSLLKAEADKDKPTIITA